MNRKIFVMIGVAGYLGLLISSPAFSVEVAEVHYSVATGFSVMNVPPSGSGGSSLAGESSSLEKQSGSGSATQTTKPTKAETKKSRLLR